MFVMLAGGMPFPQSERKETIHMICQGLNSNHRAQLADCSEQAQELIEQMINPNPSTRFSMPQVLLPVRSKGHLAAPVVSYV